MSRRRERLLAIGTMLGSIVLFLAAAEIVLRFLPVAGGVRAVPVNADNPVFHYTPNRDFTYSRDWNLRYVNRGRLNNAGFVNDQDYHKEHALPLLAVIGDSFIEASIVAYPDTLHGRLSKRLAGRLRVYSFGISGAPLSQYLIFAQHAVREYGATALVINVVGNDFDESLAAYGPKRGFWHYVPDAAGTLQLRLFEYRVRLGRELLLPSALARYVFFNLQVGNLYENLRMRWTAPVTDETRYAGNTKAEAEPRRVSEANAAIDAFLRDLPQMVGLPPSRVTFTMDGFRYPDAAVKFAGSYFAVMRRTFRAKAEALGYEVVDLDPLFFARHTGTGVQFQFPTDGHWNPAGHEVAFEGVMASRLMETLMP